MPKKFLDWVVIVEDILEFMETEDSVEDQNSGDSKHTPDDASEVL